MNRLLIDRPGAAVQLAAGAFNDTITLGVTADLSASTLHTRTSQSSGFRIVGQHEVSVRRLDEIVAEYEPNEPYLVKVDTEGHELAVLQGAQGTIESSDCIILELSVARRFEDSYRLAEVFCFLDEAGFELTDILELKRDPDTRVRRMDAAFVRR